MRRTASLALFAALLLSPALGFAQPLVEAFDAGVPAGWVAANRSNPLGAVSWFAGNPAVFGPQASSGYAAANFLATADGGTVSDWLVSPQLPNLQNGQRLTFYTRTETGAPAADRLQVRLCVGDATACQNVGTTETETGNFGALLIDVNPTAAVGGFPETWALQERILTGLPPGVNQGRIAFRHMAAGSGPGPTATGGDYVGIDSVSLEAGVPALAIAKTVSTASPLPGVAFAFNVVVSNTGSANATAVTITDDVPAGLAIGSVTIVPAGSCGVTGQLVECSVPVLPVGTSVTVSIPVTATALGSYSNTASASGAGVAAVDASAQASVAGERVIPTVQVWGLALLGLAIGLGGLFALGRAR